MYLHRINLQMVKEKSPLFVSYDKKIEENLPMYKFIFGGHYLCITL